MSELEAKKERLKNDRNLIIDKDKTTIKDKPRPNQKCPCNSKRNYKKCCMNADQNRTKEFIEGSERIV